MNIDALLTPDSSIPLSLDFLPLFPRLWYPTSSEPHPKKYLQKISLFSSSSSYSSLSYLSFLFFEGDGSIKEMLFWRRACLCNLAWKEEEEGGRERETKWRKLTVATVYYRLLLLLGHKYYVSCENQTWCISSADGKSQTNWQTKQ